MDEKIIQKSLVSYIITGICQGYLVNHTFDDLNTNKDVIVRTAIDLVKQINETI